MLSVPVFRWIAMLVMTLVVIQLVVWLLEPRMAFFPIRGVQETPAAFGLAYADQRIPTSDGETLHAWWLGHPTPRAQVLFFHGNGGNLSLWLDVIAELRRRNFSVLAVDYRGYGDSTGRPSERGIYVDATAAVDWFNRRLRQPDAPVILWGRSLGTPAAASAAAHHRPDALVLESPFADAGAIFGANPVMRFVLLFSSYSFPTLRLLERYDGPLLVIHGDRDTIIPFRAGRDLFERAPTGRKEFVVIRGADHNDLHVADPASYWAAIDRFVSGLTQ
jgi:fermentation-respiration switch protein FrsA (DUF1100 family)